MKKKLLALLLSITMVATNSAAVMAAENSNLISQISTEDEELYTADDEYRIVLEEDEEADAQADSAIDDVLIEEISDDESAPASYIDASEGDDNADDDENTIESTSPYDEDIYYEDGEDIPNGYNEIEDVVPIENPDLSDDADLIYYDENGYECIREAPEEYLTLSRYVTPNLPSLRNQNPYGSCWAHAAMALAEISLVKQGLYSPEDVNLSELHLAYFTYNTVVDPLGGIEGDSNEMIAASGSSNFMTRGGNLNLAQNVLSAWTGAADETQVPYSNAKNAISNGIDDSNAFLDEAHMTNYYNAKISSSTSDINAVKKMVYKYGAVGVAYYSAKTNYHSTYNSYNQTSKTSTNHAVAIVGWDDEFPKSKFKTQPEGDGAWIIRNSWTTGSFEDNQSYNGYFYLSYYDTSLPGNAFSFVFTPADNYDYNYQYDGGMQNSSVSGYKKVANVFKANGNETLKAVSFYTPTADVNYQVDIYTVDANKFTNPTGGTLKSTAKGLTEFAGYYTVNLPTPVSLTANTKFSVVLTLTKKSETPKYGIEYSMQTASWYRVNTAAQSKQSYVLYGSSWVDYGASSNANLRIKAFTDSNESTDIIPTGIEFSGLTSGKLSLETGQSKSVTANVLPANATNKQVTWKSSNDSIAKIAATGTTASITGVSDGTTTITATTKSGGKTASFEVTVKTVLKSIAISGESYLTDGATATYTATATPSSYNLKDITWSSSDTSVLTIDSTGKATYVAPGVAAINASCDGVSASYLVTCRPKTPEYIKIVVDANNIASIYFAGVEGADSYQITQGENGAVIAQIAADGSAEYTYKDSSYSKVTTNTTAEYSVRAIDNNAAGLFKSEYAYFGSLDTINYILNGAVNNKYNPPAYLSGKYYSLYDPAPPTDHAFLGWYRTPDYSGERVYSIATSYGGPLTLYAKLKDQTEFKYYIQFYANQGSGTMPFMYVSNKDAVTLTKNAFTKDGYLFNGWNTEPDGSGTAYADEELVTALGEAENEWVSLYAQWKRPEYSISFNANSGSGNMNPVTAQVGIELALPANQYYIKGYVFDSWNTKADGSGNAYADGETVYNLSTTNNDIVTLYAQWKVERDPDDFTFYIDCVSNGGYGSMAILTPSSKTEDKLPRCTFSKSGYSFTGWNTDANGNGASFVDEEPIRNIAAIASDGAVIKLYAQWKINEYTIRFDANTGSGVMSDIKATFGQDIPLTKNAFAKDDHAFTGWNTEPDGSGLTYTDGATISNLTTKNNVTVVLYAQWIRNSSAGPDDIEGFVPVSNISFSKSDVTIYTNGVTDNLIELADYVVLEGKDGAAPTITDLSWVSSNKSIAAVSPAGIVTALSTLGKGEQQITITAYATDGSGVSGSIDITVAYRYDPATAVVLSTKNMSMDIGDTRILDTYVKPLTADQICTYESSDSSVIAFMSDTGVTGQLSSEDGKVFCTAIGRGSAVITVTSGDGKRTAKCKVAVGPTIKKFAIQGKEGIAHVAENKTLQMVTIFNDADENEQPSNKNVTWEVYDGDGKAYINDSGVLTGVSAGMVTVVATTELLPQKIAEKKIMVTVPVSKATMDPTTLTMAPGAEATIAVNVVASTSTNNTKATLKQNDDGSYITWTLRNPADAEYVQIEPAAVETDEDLFKAKVKALKTTKSTVYVQATYTPYAGEAKTISCKVTVKNQNVSKLALNKTTLSLIEGKSAVLRANLTPIPSSGSGIRWQVASGSTYVTVKENADHSLTVTGKKASGNATIKIKAISTSQNAEGSYLSAACTVTVGKAANSVAIKAPSSAPVADGKVLVKKGGSLTLTSTVYAADGENKASNQKLMYVSSDTSVATVTNKGKIVGRKSGFATITAISLDNPDITGQIDIEVYIPATKVTMDKTKASIYCGGNNNTDYTVLSTFITPDDFFDNVSEERRQITWSVSGAGKVELAEVDYTITRAICGSEEEIAQLDYEEDVLVTTSNAVAIKAIAPGKVKITARTYSGKKASCTITVYTHANGLDLKTTTAIVPNTTDNSADYVATLARSKKTTITPLLSYYEAPYGCENYTTLSKFAVNKNVTYECDNPGVATVTKKGSITAVGKGVAYITVTTKDGGYTKTVKVVVN